MSEIKEMLLGDLPKSVLEPIVLDISKYAVLIYALNPTSDQDPKIRQIGSGTLIECDGKRGILTAHHVVHRSDVDWSSSSRDEIMLSLDLSGGIIRIPAAYLHEIVIAAPLTDEYGPDITFLEIPKGESLSALLARKSFWKINYKVEERMASCEDEHGVFVTVGQPNELEKLTQEDERTFRLDVTLRGYVGPVRYDRVYERGEYDFIDTVVRYDGQEAMPETFRGISGGGLWKVGLQFSNRNKKWTYFRPILCGLAFYQTELEAGERKLRCHYVNSIYRNTRVLLVGKN